jgi:hypothetical protein
MCGEIQGQYMSEVCKLNWIFDGELGEVNVCLGDFVNYYLKMLELKGICLCEFGSQLMECLLVNLLTNAGSLKL